MAPSTLADLYGSIATDTTQVATDQAAVVADKAKLEADQLAVTTEQAQLTTDQAAFSAALSQSGPGFITNPDGSISVVSSSDVSPGYALTTYVPLSSLPIPVPVGSTTS